MATGLERYRTGAARPALLALALAATSSIQPLVAAAQPASGRSTGPLDLEYPHSERQLLVHLAPMPSTLALSERAERSRQRFFQHFGLVELRRAERIRVAIVQLRSESGDRALQEAATRLLERPDLFQTVEPNHRYFFAQGSNPDAVTGLPWGLAQIRAPEAWSITKGSTAVTVAVIDSGVETAHPSFAGQLWWNPAEGNGNPNWDDDENGYVDDVEGWSWAGLGENANTGLGSADIEDQRDHGTQVAGVIGARHGEQSCLPGVAADIRLLPLKVAGETGVAHVGEVVLALDYAVGVGADIVNLSGSTTWNEALLKELQDAAGLLVVAAAGQDGQNLDDNVSYPCSFRLPNVVCVTATDADDALAPSANFGEATVHLGAPGYDIVSTIRGATCQAKSGTSTSLAAPHAAGVAALVKARCPNASVAQVRERLLDGQPVDSLANLTASGTRLDSSRAVAPACLPPPAQGGLARFVEWLQVHWRWPWLLRNNAGDNVTPK